MTIRHTWTEFDKVGVKYEKDGKVETKYVEPAWYFGIKLKDLEKAKSILDKYTVSVVANSIFPEYAIILCEDIWANKIKIQNRYDVVLELEDNGIKTYEGDLVNDKRWLLDNDIEISLNYRKLYIDIETDDSQELLEIGRDFILSFAAIDNQGKEYYIKLNNTNPRDELVFLKSILKIINNYDILLGWNISGFDLPYLKERMKKYKLEKTKDWQFKKLGVFDLLKRMKHIYRFDSNLRMFNLNYISKHFLDKEKIKLNEKIISLWKNNSDILKEYNLNDSKLVKELDEKLGISDMMIRQASWCLVPPSQFGLYSIIDSYILRTAHKIGQMCPTGIQAIKERTYNNTRGNLNPDEVSTDKGKYIGAVVLEPKVGVYGKVYTFDFKGLYPSMMRTSNIGYDSLRDESDDNRITNPGTYSILRLTNQLKPTYFEKTPSVINLAISELIEKRNEYKELKLEMIEQGKDSGPLWDKVVSDEIIVKELANSTYGIMGLSYGRYYNIDIAESITLFGQWCINFAKEFFENSHFKVIYGDTDSVFVDTKHTAIDVESILEQFHFALNKELSKYNIDKSYIQLNFDKEYERFILFAKKTYAGHCINIEGKKTDKIYARGLDFIKKSTFRFAAEKQQELISLILRESYDENLLKSWALKVKKEFYLKNFEISDITLVNRVGKRLNEYTAKTVPLHVKLAKEVYEKTGTWNQEIEYVITSSFGKMDGILAKDYKGYFDRDYYWKNKVVPLIQRVIDVVYPDIQDIFSMQTSLF
jgi:DNA polymerase elongation subunit (family B)